MFVVYIWTPHLSKTSSDGAIYSETTVRYVGLKMEGTTERMTSVKAETWDPSG